MYRRDEPQRPEPSKARSGTKVRIKMYPQRLSLPRVRAHSETENIPKAAEVGGGMESSLLQLIHDHHQSSFKLQEQTEKAKRDAIKNGKRVADLLVDIVNGGVEESFINEKRIELEIRYFISTALRYSKQTDQWLAATHAINSALKEIGDFENWMKTMDYDCKSINAAIRNIYQS